MVGISDSLNSQFLVTVNFVDNTKIGDFIFKNLIITEEICCVPIFKLFYESTSVKDSVGKSELLISINNNNKIMTYPATVLGMEKNYVYGVLITKDCYSTRRSRELDFGLKSSILSLGIRNDSSDMDIYSDNKFLQMNETDIECANRLLKYCGYDKLWGITHNKIKIFSVYPKVEEYVYPTGKENLPDVFNCSRTVLSLNDNNIENRENFNFGRINNILPFECGFSKDCVYSYVAKNKFKNGWYNIRFAKNSGEDLDIELGTTIKFFNYRDYLFITTKKVIDCSPNNCSFYYEFSNYDGWKPFV